MSSSVRDLQPVDLESSWYIKRHVIYVDGAPPKSIQYLFILRIFGLILLF